MKFLKVRRSSLKVTRILAMGLVSHSPGIATRHTRNYRVSWLLQWSSHYNSETTRGTEYFLSLVQPCTPRHVSTNPDIPGMWSLATYTRGQDIHREHLKPMHFSIKGKNLARTIYRRDDQSMPSNFTNHQSWDIQCQHQLVFPPNNINHNSV